MNYLLKTMREYSCFPRDIHCDIYMLVTCGNSSYRIQALDFLVIFYRVVPDADFEAGYRILGYPDFKKPDPDIRTTTSRIQIPDIRNSN